MTASAALPEQLQAQLERVPLLSTRALQPLTKSSLQAVLLCAVQRGPASAGTMSVCGAAQARLCQMGAHNALKMGTCSWCARPCAPDAKTLHP